MLCLNISDIAIMTGKGVDNRYIIHDSKFEAIPVLESSVLDDCLMIYTKCISKKSIFKGGLSGQMTWQFLNALELFSPEKANCSIFVFVKSFFSTKKSPKVVNLPLNDEKLCLSFWRHKQAKWGSSLGSYISLWLISQKLYIILKVLLNH